MVVRTDPTQEDEFSDAEEWGVMNQGTFSTVSEPGKRPVLKINPFSGGERNRLFMQHDGQFVDVTLASGTDMTQDGRGFVLFDYDHDGFLDMGLYGPNTPRFRILRNRVGELQESTGKKLGVVRLHLVGGNDDNEPNTEYSARDAIGASILATVGDRTTRYQRNCGEGLSTQNSSQVSVGLGTADAIDKLKVVWPSGRETVVENIPAGQLLTIHERGQVNQEAIAKSR